MFDLRKKYIESETYLSTFLSTLILHLICCRVLGYFNSILSSKHVPLFFSCFASLLLHYVSKISLIFSYHLVM